MRSIALILSTIINIHLLSQSSFFPHPQYCDFIHLTENGLLFLSSTEGLFYHDGDQLHKIDLPDIGETNIQGGFYPDDNNNLWFCTYSRIVKLNLLDNSYSNYPLVNAQGDTLNSDYYIFHLEDSLLFAKAGDDIYQFNLHDHSCRQLHGSVDGRRLKLVSNIRNQTFLSYYYTYIPSIVRFSSLDSISSIEPWKNWPAKTLATDIMVIDSNAVLITSTKGLYKGDIRMGSIQPVHSVILDQRNIRSICGYTSDKALLSITGEGNFLLDLASVPYSPRLNRFDYEGIPDVIDRMLPQADGTIFLSCYDDGIYFIHPDHIKFTNLYYDRPENKEFFDKFFMHWEHKDMRTESTLSGSLMSISSGKHEFISKTPFTSSLLYIKGQGSRPYPHPVNITLYGFFKSYNGDLYAGFVNGEIYHFLLTGPEKIPTPDFNLKGVNFYYSIGTQYNLAGVNNEMIVTWDQANPENTRKQISFTGNIHNAIYLPENDLIALATTAGIGLLPKAGQHVNLFNADQSCYCVLNDDNGNLWYSTASEIVRFEVADQKSIVYNSSAGTSQYKYQKGNCKKLSADSLLFFHEKGATLVLPNNLSKLNRNSLIHIGDFKVNDLIHPFPNYLNYNERFESTYGNNTISFVLNNVDWSDPDATLIKYKLEGLDQNWIYLDSRNQTVRYSKIPPGNYKLKIIGQNADRVWNNNPKVVDIIIQPPYWQTWWFISLSVLAFASFIYWLVKSYYQRKLQKKNQLLREQSLIIEKQQAIENERTRIASEMHDDLGSGLTTIRYLSDKALKQAKDSEEANQIKRIADHSNTLVRNMSEIIWAMNSRFDNTENLTGYLRRYASEYLDERQMAFTFNAEEDNVSAAIGGEKRRNIFLVFKELLHNTVKYSQARSVMIAIETGNDFVITISELGGIGFNPEESIEKGNGLFNCRKRLKSIDGNLTFEKTNDAMNIIISVPINSPTLA